MLTFGDKYRCSCNKLFLLWKETMAFCVFMWKMHHATTFELLNLFSSQLVKEKKNSGKQLPIVKDIIQFILCISSPFFE